MSSFFFTSAWRRMLGPLCAMLLVASGCVIASDEMEPQGQQGGSGGQGGQPTEPDPWQQTRSWQAKEIASCPVEPTPDDALVALLDGLSLDLSVGIEMKYYELFGFEPATDPARLPYFHELQQDLTKVPCTGANFALRADEAMASKRPLATSIADAAAAMGLVIDVGGSWPALDQEAPLYAFLETWHQQLGMAWDAEGTKKALEPLALDLRRQVARLVLGAQQAAVMRDEAIFAMLGEANIDDVFERARYTQVTGPKKGLDPDNPNDLALLAPEASLSSRLYAGAARLAQAVDETDFDSMKTAAGTEPIDVFVDTPMGAIVIRGAEDDVYDPTIDDRFLKPLLLVIDVGGNDTYRIAAGANASARHPVALHIDLSGDDEYAYVEVPHPKDGPGLLVSDDAGRFAGGNGFGPISFSPHARQGAGMLGYGMLLDRGQGKDSYRSHRFSQAYASLGVGVLFDDGGSDSYTCESTCQATSVSGLALLIDGGGDDTYRAFQGAQSFAQVSGFSLLHDRDGSDAYELVPREPFLFPWFSGYPNNLSRGQGAATGWRRDGVQLGGGVAVLRDASGDDRYRAAVMAQGNGYWFGFGVLADGAGNDEYDLVAYGQGGTQHFALSAFLEGGGNDSYNERIKDEIETPRNALGSAHDFSVSFFVEAGGDDRYYAPGVAIGASKCHGLGVFVERGGDDAYNVSENSSIGWATDFDWKEGDCGNATDWPSYGLFVDLDGSDMYEKPDARGYGDGQTWLTDDPTDSSAMELSGGIDQSGGDTFARAYGSLWMSETSASP